MSNRYRTEQAIAISGWECGTEIEMRMVVTYTVHPSRKATEFDPPEEASVEIDKVRFFDGKAELTLPWSIEDRFTSTDGFKAWLMQEASDQYQAAVEARADARREELREDRA